MKQKLVIFALSLLAVPVLLEGLLRLFDPWGAYYYDDLDWVVSWDLTQMDEGGTYVVPSGTWGFTFERTRLVPATQPADCQIVAIGDSLTFGYGVVDADTWVNRLAGAYPDVEFINAGITGYNTAQAYTRAADFPADGYLYLIVYNDSDGPMEFGERVYRWYAKTKLMRYWDTWRQFSRPTPTYVFSDFGMEPPQPIRYFLWGQMDNVPTGTRSIPIQNRISFIDEHPNAAGHQVIFEHMREPVGAFINAVCPP